MLPQPVFYYTKKTSLLFVYTVKFAVLSFKYINSFFQAFAINNNLLLLNYYKLFIKSTNNGLINRRRYQFLSIAQLNRIKTLFRLTSKNYLMQQLFLYKYFSFLKFIKFNTLPLVRILPQTSSMYLLCITYAMV